MDEQQEQTIEPGAAGAPEGVVGAEPSIDEIAELYKATGVKAPVPTGKAKGRPKTADVRAKNNQKNGAGNSDAGEQGNEDDSSEPKNAPASSKDGDSGDKADAKGSKNSKDAGSVQDESEEADSGVRGAKPRDEKDAERGSEEDAELGADRAGQEAHDEDDSEEEGKDDEKGKRPGKSNPEVERRMQQLTAEKKAAEQRAVELEQKLQAQAVEQERAKISQEDPEYTMEDFLKVRDENGNILDLDPEQAELAWRRWKDGYNQRATEREARANHEAAQQQRAEATSMQLMQDSADAYDALASLMDEYPELVSTSGSFDREFAAEAMPLIRDSLKYVEGTEPGNAQGNQPVILGLNIHPKKILAALKNINGKKRTLPLNGLNDNVEPRSNVSVPHSRSSDPNVHAANELYKTLGINKRI